jgi:pimeloyl-ACP methyl ester carboxylesterase
VNAPGISTDSYEPDDSAAAAKTITNGQTQNRSIHVAGNVDWVKFTVAAGASNLRIETSGSSGDTQLWLYGPNSSTSQLAYDDDDGTGYFSLITTSADSLPTLLPAGTYYIKVQEYNNDGIVPAYTLTTSWTEASSGITPDSYEADDSASTAKTITNGVTQNRNIHVAGNVDWVKFTVVNGASGLRIETNGSSGGDTQLYVYGPNSMTTQVAGGYNDDEGTGNYSLLVSGLLGFPTSLPPGTYYIKVQEYGNNNTIASYTLQATWTDTGGGSGITADSYEADDSASTAKTITNGVTQNRNIHVAGNTDWVKFTVVSGASNLRIETNGSGGDTQIWLYGPNSESSQVAGGYNDDDGNGNFSLLVAGQLGLPTTLSPGTYYIKVQDYNNDGTIGAYTLQATWTDSGGGLAADSYEADNSSAAAKTITNGETQSRNIHVVGDVDWAKFTVPNGATDARIETNGSSGDTEIWLYGANNMVYAVGYDNDDGNGNFSLLSPTDLPSLPPGTYYIKVQEYGNDGTIPAYTLRASWTEAPRATVIAPNVAASLNGDARSMKYFTVQVPAGQVGLEIRLWGGTGNAEIYVGKDTFPSPTDTTSYLGLSVTTAQNERIRLSGATPGTYNILVYGTTAYSGVKLKVTIGNPAQVVLLLHGMNSDVDTWSALIKDFADANSEVGYVGKIYNGALTGSAPQSIPGLYFKPIYFYAVNFGAMDLNSGYKGFDLENGTTSDGTGSVPETYKPLTALNSDGNGDYSDFNQLGSEVKSAVDRILTTHGINTRIVLVAHSRGGLAARAFLQNPTSSSAKNSIDAVMTLGTPHLGSRLGRVYRYLINNPSNKSVELGEDWEAAKSYRIFGKGVNVGVPAVKFLADNSDQIFSLNSNTNNLSSQICYGMVSFEGVTFGILPNPIGDIFGGSAWPYKNLSGTCRDFILSGTALESEIGDGIVSRNSQKWNNLPGWPNYTIDSGTSISGVLHAGAPLQGGETDQTGTIISRLRGLVGWW